MNERGKPPMGERGMTKDHLPKEAFVKGGLFNWKYFEAHPEMIVPEALNNFHMAMPGGSFRQRAVEMLAMMPELADDPDQKQQQKLFVDIDRTAQEIGLDLRSIEEELGEIFRLVQKKQVDAAMSIQGRIREKILPLYKKLREMGYSHKDLVQ